MSSEQINHEAIIAYRISQLNGECSEEMPKEYQGYLVAYPELQEELEFIESYWQKPAIMEQPSAQVRTRFYQMLSQAQGAQTARKVASEDSVSYMVAPTGKDRTDSIWTKISSWLAPRPAVQFASLGFCFVAGFMMNQPGNVNEGAELTSLQQEIQSLSTMVALNMLQNPSASERLNGVAYTSQLSVQDPQLDATLIALLQNDQSTSVRLAILRMLRESNNVQAYEATLSELALTETNTLVQIQLIQLLLERGSPQSSRALIQQLSEIELSSDVEVLLSEMTRSSQI